MNPKKKVIWAEKCLERAVKLLPAQTTVRMTYRYDEDRTATCIAEPEYFRAIINVNLEDLRDEKEIAQYIFHEVMHIPIWPLFQVAKRLAKNANDRTVLRKVVVDANEYVTTSLELMFFKLVFPEFNDGGEHGSSSKRGEG